MKLEVGMYVRTKDGFIDEVIIKYQGYCNNPNCKCKHVSCKYNYYDEENIVKASHNIIDLIKHKDIILGKDGKLYQCWKVYKDYVFTYSKNKQGQTITLVDYQIDKVLCYEQFESMSYRIGD